MSGFSAEWLALREPVDHSARSDITLAGVSGWFARDTRLNITDIGSGTGSTLRALKPIMYQTLNWHLVDNDDGLLEVAKREANGDQVDFSLADLSENLEPLFTHSPDLITTSAFLDLVSAKWLENMVSEITQRKIPFYAALTYDGRAACNPSLEEDSAVLDAFNAHQKTDKGFGPALGPEAADHAIKLFREAGYQVSAQESDWIGNNKHKRFQIMLLEGWYEAAIQIEPDKEKEFKNWLNNRINLIENSDASLFVGHKDFFAVPV